MLPGGGDHREKTFLSRGLSFSSWWLRDDHSASHKSHIGFLLQVTSRIEADQIALLGP